MASIRAWTWCRSGQRSVVRMRRAKLLMWRRWAIAGGCCKPFWLPVLQRVNGNRTAREVALDQAKAHLDAGLRLCFVFHAFGQRHRAGCEDHLHKVTNDLAFAFACVVQPANQSHVELDEMCRYIRQFKQASLSGTEVVIGETDAEFLETVCQFAS